MMVQPPAGILVPLATEMLPAPAVAVTPVHVPAKLFGVATTILPGVVGKVSENALLNVIALPPGLDSEIVSCVLPPDAILGTAKLLVTAKGAVTVKFAVFDATPTVGDCVVVTPLDVLGSAPPVLLVTCTVTVQPPAGKLGTLKFNAVAPTVSAGVLVTPTQVPVMPVEAMLILVSVSVNVALVSALALELPKVNVSALVPPLLMVAGEKALAMMGLFTTVKLTGPKPVPAGVPDVVVTPLTELGLVPTTELVT